MQFIIYLLTYPFFMMVSLLPFKVMYLLSDLFYLILYYIIGYRKKVVRKNLKLAYPDKTEEERLDLEKKSYRHFVDIFFEMAKTFTVSKKELLKRYKFSNTELIDRLHKDGRSVIMMSSHYGNWEWVVGMPLSAKIDCYTSYTKIQNKNFEDLIKNSRSKFGMICLKSTEIIKGIVKNVKEQKQGLYLLVSDQSPQIQKNQYWTDFLNVKVPIFTGAEMISKKFDFAVVNMNTTKVKRGYYESEFELITDSPKELTKNEITNAYLRITEEHIYKQPNFYLWSHKRFKHKDKAPK